uniref:Uncharacterized protein n=1 Tax=Setaria viridis TaxID=4556 RepID=A0A4V6Y7T6_SETVI|nr:hypothetical protein SEVIR_9G426250v2 [Setaria viridis]
MARWFSSSDISYGPLALINYWNYLYWHSSVIGLPL